MAFQFSRAADKDNAALKKLFCETPQDDGPVTMVLEREPNFFAAYNLLVTDPCMWLARDTEKTDDDQNVVGLMSVGSRQVFVNGTAKQIRYISDLRIHPDYRKGTLLARLYRQGKKEIEDLNEWAQTVILDDNQLSKDVITKGRGGLPDYYPMGALTSYYINNGRLKPKKRTFNVRQAEISDVDQMQQFFNEQAKLYQGYPVYDFSLILENNNYYLNQRIESYSLVFDADELVGMTGVWDQGAIKQVRFEKYNGVYKFLKPLVNGLGYFQGIQPFPKAGGILKYKYLHCILVKDNRVDIFDDLLAYIVHRFGNTREALMLGLMENSPLNECVKPYRNRTTRSLHYLVSWGKDPRLSLNKSLPWYIEAARL